MKTHTKGATTAGQSSPPDTTDSSGIIQVSPHTAAASPRPAWPTLSETTILPSITDTAVLSERHIAKAAELRLVQDEGIVVDIRKTDGTRLGSFVIGVDDVGKTFIVRDFALAGPPTIDPHTQLCKLQISVEAIRRQP